MTRATAIDPGPTGDGVQKYSATVEIQGWIEPTDPQRQSEDLLKGLVARLTNDMEVVVDDALQGELRFEWENAEDYPPERTKAELTTSIEGGSRCATIVEIVGRVYLTELGAESEELAENLIYQLFEHVDVVVQDDEGGEERYEVNLADDSPTVLEGPEEVQYEQEALNA